MDHVHFLGSRGDAIEIRNARVARRAAFSHTSCVTSFDACTAAQSSFDPWAILTPNFVANLVLHLQVQNSSETDRLESH
jgi:hypothetical protein